MVTVFLLEIMLTISSNTGACESGFSCMNRENSVLRTRSGEDTLDHIMLINNDQDQVKTTGPHYAH